LTDSVLGAYRYRARKKVTRTGQKVRLKIDIMSSELSIKLGIVGGGNMAKAIVLPLFKKGVLKPENVIVSARTDATLEAWREAGCATTFEKQEGYKHVRGDFMGREATVF